VREQLAEGELWPDAVLQLNPAYDPGPTLGELAASGAIAADTARFFGPGLRLHRHQAEALAAAARGQHYIVSTGTGSGKSLTYLVPIFDAILRDDPARHSVRALIVYPMNALINSQVEALNTFRAENWPGCPVRFSQYTGQIREETRQQLLQDPPHILLTNYVMLEYMLIRPQERALVGETIRDLQFLTVDELHVYRGRQGADVAMLLRRLRQRAGRPNLQCAGTSATIATGGTRATRRAQIAEVGSRLFGVPVAPESVIDETLQRLALVPVPATPEALRAAVEMSPPAPDSASVAEHPGLGRGEFWSRLGGRPLRPAPTDFFRGRDRGACQGQWPFVRAMRPSTKSRPRSRKPSDCGVERAGLCLPSAPVPRLRGQCARDNRATGPADTFDAGAGLCRPCRQCRSAGAVPSRLLPRLRAGILSRQPRAGR
jgi:hypothetical protein